MTRGGAGATPHGNQSFFCFFLVHKKEDFFLPKNLIPIKARQPHPRLSGLNFRKFIKMPRAIPKYVAAGGLLLTALLPRIAAAIPSFAAQTGLPCSACHIGFPQLTPFGRLFKLQGYVANGDFPDYKKFAVMAQAGFTQLHDKVPGGLAPDYPSNNGWSVQQTSLFYGGALDKNLGLGAFAQVTYDGVAHQWHWDNLDIRLARPADWFNHAVYYGFTFNNNPGVTDLWNTPPTWGCPYIAPELGVGSAADVQLASLGQTVSGVGGYAEVHLNTNNLVYLETDFYKSLPNHAAYTLGVGPGTPISGPIPYWRVAVEHDWRANTLEVGTIGLIDNPYPGGLEHGPTDHLVDVGVDAQFQHITATQAISFQATYIHESQHWGASYGLGNTANLNDTLNSLLLTGSYLYNQAYGITESYSNKNGSADGLLYTSGDITGVANGKPNTQSFTTELDYYPFSHGGPSFMPIANAKFFVEETIYTQFNGLAHNYDGSGRNAQGNDVLFTGVWVAF